jgi:protoporphyrinogen oxidase
MKKQAVIIGAGPAGLTAALELVRRTDIVPVVLEASSAIGGISRTVNCRGNRIDLGGHRFYSKSDRVVRWWLDILPLQSAASFCRDFGALDPVLPCPAEGPDPSQSDLVMMVRRRLSRIRYDGKLFDYPLSLTPSTIANLGFLSTAAIGFSYVRSRLFQIAPEKNLEDFFINRFGCRLYEMFFRDYTEKVWGMACSAISPDWGAQRVKGLSIGKAIADALKSMTGKSRNGTVETPLIRSFMYPKLGPGQLWEEVARRVEEGGGTILRNHTAVGVISEGLLMRAVVAQNERGERKSFDADYVMSSMALADLAPALGSALPREAANVAAGLPYRDFIMAGLLLREMRPDKIGPRRLPDNWIYIQEKQARMGRMQVYNNWSPYMVADPRTTWLGLEYFCRKGDDLWELSDKAMADFAFGELVKLGLADPSSFIDATIVRQPRAYPAYFGAYKDIGVVQKALDRFENFFPIGRNGMHKYNNMDHSMLTAMTAVDCVAGGTVSKEALWSINTEEDYGESKG